MTNKEKSKVVPISDATEKQTIAKSSGFTLDKFKVKKAAVLANVETLPGALPHYKIAQARDFVRAHPDTENYQSPPLCLVSVPVKGQKGDALHLIDEDLAIQFLEPGQIQRFSLALASKPHDVFFLVHVPTENLDNSFNMSALSAIEQARTRWVQVTSRKAEGVDSYKIGYARDEDSFPEPKWPARTLAELIETAFTGRMITDTKHPALLRLLGAKQALS